MYGSQQERDLRVQETARQNQAGTEICLECN